MYMRWGMFRSLLMFGIGQALTNLLYMWLALAGKKVWLLVLATVLGYHDRRHGSGGLRRLSGVAVLARISAPRSTRCLSALATLPRNVTGAIAGHLVPVVGWANFFVVTCLTAVPGLILLVILRRPLQRTGRARSRESLRRARRAASRARSGSQRRSDRSFGVDHSAARVVLELAIQIFGFHIHGARPVFRRIGRVDEIVEQMLVPANRNPSRSRCRRSTEFRWFDPGRRWRPLQRARWYRPDTTDLRSA